VRIAAMPMAGIAGVENVTETSAPEMGAPLASVIFTRNVLLPLRGGSGSVVSSAFACGAFIAPAAPAPGGGGSRKLTRFGRRRQESRHSGVLLRVDTELSHSVHKGGSVDTQADCSTISTTDVALACGKRLYDFLALLPFILLGAGVDVRS